MPLFLLLAITVSWCCDADKHAVILKHLHGHDYTLFFTTSNSFRFGQTSVLLKSWANPPVSHILRFIYANYKQTTEVMTMKLLYYSEPY
jgi:hypothetical protein